MLKRQIKRQKNQRKETSKMARFRMEDADNYGGTGGAGFFSLKNDKDVATVRFLYDSVDDIEGFAVHEVEINGKKRNVNCLRSYDEPVDACPFCREHKPQRAKVFIPVYNVDEGQNQIWERGKKMFSTLTSVFSRCDDAPIVSQEFEIERNGKPHDTNTTYSIFRTRTPADDKTLDDFEEVNLSNIVLDKSAEDMEYYLENGQFPPTDNEDGEVVTRRSQSRRAPARNSRRDEF